MFKKIISKFKADGDKSLKLNMVVGFISKPIALVLSYIYVPIALSFLGVEKYGVWSTILTILSWISYCDIGIGNGLRNKLTVSFAQENKELSQKLISSAYLFITILMALVVAIFVVVAQFLDWNVIFGVETIDESLKNIVCISVAFVAVTFIFSLCKNIFYALQESGIVSVIELLIQTINLVGVIILSQFYACNLLAICLLYGSSMVSVNALFALILSIRRKDCRPKIKAIDIKAGMQLTNLGLKFFVIQICALILFTTDSLMISIIYGACDVTPYSTVNKLYNAIATCFTAVLAPVWSAVTKAKAEGNYEWLKKLIRRLHLLMIPFFVGAIGLVFIFRPLSNWWLGQELDYAYGLIPFGAAYCIFKIWCDTYAYIGNGLELMRVSMAVAIAQAVVNIPLSLLFAVVCGMETSGILLGTVVSMLIAVIIMPVYIHRHLNKLTKNMSEDCKE